MNNPNILVAGATGNLGQRIVKSLLSQNAQVKAIVGKNTSSDKITKLQKLGVTIVKVDFKDPSSMTQACSGAACVVSSLSGLRDVIVETQTALLNAAITAGVPRFIPSDFAIDFTKIPTGMNRNFDFRREFYSYINKTPIQATSILNGAFADMLTGQAPIILFKLNRVLYWENADQLMDFTTIEDTAAFTAAAALDPTTPRILKIAGNQISARELVSVVSDVTGKKFQLLRAGSLGTLQALIKFVRLVHPGKEEIFPPWQGMQYLHNMFDGRAKLEPLDNKRYPEIKWTPVSKVIESR
jgi:nucleoside-diphosphate-sugar epimerase